MLSISICFSDGHAQVAVVDDSGFCSTIKLDSIDEILDFIADCIDEYEYLGI